MKVIKDGQSWEKALAALKKGKFARHAHWVAHDPSAGQDDQIKTALGLRENPSGGSPTFGVFSDAGKFLHDWRPNAAEHESRNWQIVELDLPVEGAPAARK